MVVSGNYYMVLCDCNIREVTDEIRRELKSRGSAYFVAERFKQRVNKGVAYVSSQMKQVEHQAGDVYLILCTGEGFKYNIEYIKYIKRSYPEIRWQCVYLHADAAPMYTYDPFKRKHGSSYIFNNAYQYIYSQPTSLHELTKMYILAEEDNIEWLKLNIEMLMKIDPEMNAIDLDTSDHHIYNNISLNNIYMKILNRYDIPPRPEFFNTYIRMVQLDKTRREVLELWQS